ncbi:SDR family oxidoreductase [Verticiella sediminum]|uniref:SDR family oxidoreductase n=1 Tax=Verticiella sediminum TaxID=1247510 RepID=A0A556AIP3_9BURK|nr:SDR family oxidoreductase [Verticiella sediminum]TSH92740.1 SDR family oxidoreductase [Verticiella sediminum]
MEKHRTIVVTGASRGIGAEIAGELARRGHAVACLSRSGSPPDVHDAVGLADLFFCLRCDVSREDDLRAAFGQVAERFGGIDGLVNNAGIHRDGASRAFPTAEFETVLRINAVSVFAACREVYPYLVQSGDGLIVNIGSFFERLGAKGSTAYCAAKAAVGAITRCLAAEWGRKGISVLNVAPGYIETDINRDYLSDPEHGQKVRSRTFTGRPGTPDEIARLVAALFTERIGFLTGESIYVDGGHSISL